MKPTLNKAITEAELQAMPPADLLAYLASAFRLTRLPGGCSPGEKEAYRLAWWVAGECGLDAERRRVVAEVQADLRSGKPLAGVGWEPELVERALRRAG